MTVERLFVYSETILIFLFINVNLEEVP